VINGVENSKVYGFLLDGFNEKRLVAKYLNEIEYNGTNEVVIQCLGPVVAHIVKQIIDKNGPSQFVKENLHLLMLMIDVDKITTKLVDYCENFLPIGLKYLKNLDTQAEFMLLFSSDYVYGLIERLRNCDIKLIRELKLKQINKL